MMKQFASRLLFTCGLMVVLAAALAPAVVRADEEFACPTVVVDCGGGHLKSCAGRSDGAGHCVYSESCMTCGSLAD